VTFLIGGVDLVTTNGASSLASHDHTRPPGHDDVNAPGRSLGVQGR
jgi:hypothetical protein